MIPVDSIVVNLMPNTSPLADTHNARAVKQAVIDTDIVSGNCIYCIIWSRTCHPESAFVVMAVIVLVHYVLVAVVKVKSHTILIALRMGCLIVLHSHIIAVPHPDCRMGRVSAVVPVLAGAFYHKVLLCNTAVCVNKDNTVTSYIIDIILCNIYIGPSYPFSFSCILCSAAANQHSGRPGAFHVNCFVADILHFIAHNG